MDFTERKRLIKEFGLPKGTKFAGYVVHLEESDEFLAKYHVGDDMDGWWWSEFPDAAIKFKKLKEAVKVIKRHNKGAIVARLMDVGERYILLLPEHLADINNIVPIR